MLTIKKRSKAQVVVLALLLVYCLYAGAYIYRTSFVVEGERYFSLFDDAMVSMRYARNLARGHGLVWNPGGERVEGYTNPLWVLFMAALHLLPVAPERISLLVQLAGALFLALNLLYCHRLAGLLSEGSTLAPLAAVIVTAFYLPLNTWGLQGTEVSILALALSASLWKALVALRSQRFSPGPYLLLGASTLVRLDMAVPYLAVLTYLVAVDRRNRGRHLLAGAGVLAVFVLGQTLLRLWYYGDPLPNTYYLKMTGYPFLLRLSRGLYVALRAAEGSEWVLVLVGLGILALRRDRLLPLLGWVFLGQVAYSIYAGGDAWEWWGGANRYVAIAMPALFVAFACILARIGRRLGERLGEPRGLAYAQWGVVALALLSLSGFGGEASGRQTPADWLLLRPPLHVLGNKDAVSIARLVRLVTRSDARVAVVWAGAIPYYAEREAVDLLGKSDRHVAHLPMRLPPPEDRYKGFYPGHLKWDYGYSIGELQPDAVVQLWQSPEEAMPFLEPAYVKVNLRGFDFYLRQDSDRILWAEVEALAGRERG